MTAVTDDDEITFEDLTERKQDREDRSSRIPGTECAPGSIVEDLMNSDTVFGVEKIADVLLSGPDSERDFALLELSQLLDHCLEDTIKILIPIMCSHVHEWGVNVQFRVGEGLTNVVALPMTAHTSWIISTAAFRVLHEAPNLQMVESERGNFFELWGSMLVEALFQVDWNAGRSQEALAFLDECSTHGASPLRKIAARLLAPLGKGLPSQTSSMSLLPRALVYCRDHDVTVRGTAVDSLAEIGQQVSLKKTENEIWPILEILLEDSDARIRAASLRTLSRILNSQRLRPGSSPAEARLFRELLPPLMSRWTAFGRKAASQDQRLVDDDTYLLLEVVAEVFGELAYSNSLYKETHFRKYAMKAFVSMATCNGPLIRRNCSFNMPGMSLVLCEKYSTELCTVVDCLSKDADEEVRWILAAGFHETVRILLPNGRPDRLLSAFGSLSQDTSSKVRQNLLNHFADTVTTLTKNGDLSAMRKLVPMLQKLEKIDEFSWRNQQQFAEEVDKSVHIIPPQILLDKTLPILYDMILKGNRLVKASAMTSMIKCFRYIPDVYLRDEAIANYWGRCLSENFAVRLAFLSGGKIALDIFSQRLFRHLFAPRLLMCTRDPVVNVRLALALMLPPMAVSCGKLPLFGVALTILKKDPDSEIRNFMKKFHAYAGKAMQEDSNKLADDVRKMRMESKFFGEAKRVNAMKPNMMSLVKERVSSSRHRSKESLASEETSPGRRNGDKGPLLSPTEVNGSLRSGRLMAQNTNRKESFSDFGERNYDSSNSLDTVRSEDRGWKTRRSTSLKSVLEKYGWPKTGSDPGSSVISSTKDSRESGNTSLTRRDKMISSREVTQSLSSDGTPFYRKERETSPPSSPNPRLSVRFLKR